MQARLNLLKAKIEEANIILENAGIKNVDIIDHNQFDESIYESDDDENESSERKAIKKQYNKSINLSEGIIDLYENDLVSEENVKAISAHSRRSKDISGAIVLLHKEGILDSKNRDAISSYYGYTDAKSLVMLHKENFLNDTTRQKIIEHQRIEKLYYAKIVIILHRIGLSDQEIYQLQFNQTHHAAYFHDAIKILYKNNITDKENYRAIIKVYGKISILELQRIALGIVEAHQAGVTVNDDIRNIFLANPTFAYWNVSGVIKQLHKAKIPFDSYLYTALQLAAITSFPIYPNYIADVLEKLFELNFYKQLDPEFQRVFCTTVLTNPAATMGLIDFISALEKNSQEKILCREIVIMLCNYLVMHADEDLKSKADERLQRFKKLETVNFSFCKTFQDVWNLIQNTLKIDESIFELFPVNDKAKKTFANFSDDFRLTAKIKQAKVALEKAGLKDDYFDNEKYQEDRWEIAQGIIALDKEEILTLDNLIAILFRPERANVFADKLIRLHQLTVLNDQTRFSIQDHESYITIISTAKLNDAKCLNDQTQRLIETYSHFSDTFMADIIIILLKASVDLEKLSSLCISQESEMMSLHVALNGLLQHDIKEKENYEAILAAGLDFADSLSRAQIALQKENVLNSTTLTILKTNPQFSYPDVSNIILLIHKNIGLTDEKLLNALQEMVDMTLEKNGLFQNVFNSMLTYTQLNSRLNSQPIPIEHSRQRLWNIHKQLSILIDSTIFKNENDKTKQLLCLSMLTNHTEAVFLIDFLNQLNKKNLGHTMMTRSLCSQLIGNNRSIYFSKLDTINISKCQTAKDVWILVQTTLNIHEDIPELSDIQKQDTQINVDLTGYKYTGTFSDKKMDDNNSEKNSKSEKYSCRVM